jgi:hypothetical protein
MHKHGFSYSISSSIKSVLRWWKNRFFYFARFTPQMEWFTTLNVTVISRPSPWKKYTHYFYNSVLLTPAFVQSFVPDRTRTHFNMPLLTAWFICFILKIEAARLSAILTPIYQTIQWHNPEDHSLNIHCCGNIRAETICSHHTFIVSYDMFQLIKLSSCIGLFYIHLYSFIVHCLYIGLLVFFSNM